MQLIVLIFGSGLAFFLGVGCVLAAVGASFGRWWGWTTLSTILAALGVIVVVLLGTPLPVWYYAFAIALTAVWMVCVRLTTWKIRHWQRSLAAAVAVAWAVGALFEFQFHIMPDVPTVTSHRLYLFGDSLAAGVNDDTSHNWPQLLALSHKLDMADFSRAGATTAMALRAARGVSFDDGVVLLEIGGNDLLGSTSAEQFERDLDALLNQVSQSGMQVVMFELPIPPLHNGYGGVQRRLAAKYQMSLIPKRVLTSIIAGNGSTIDSLHLSAEGHREMAEAVWNAIGSAYDR